MFDAPLLINKFLFYSVPSSVQATTSYLANLPLRELGLMKTNQNIKAHLYEPQCHRHQARLMPCDVHVHNESSMLFSLAPAHFTKFNAKTINS